MKNNFFKMMSLISMLALFVTLATPSTLPPISNRIRCPSVKISPQLSPNERKKSLRKLSKCHVIEGSLVLQDLILSNASLPNLIEVTDFVILQDISVFSLPSFLPSLSIIRGRELFKGYGLLLQGVCSHEFCPATQHDQIGVINLKAVTTWSFLRLLRGAAFLADNKLLCFQQESYWEDVMKQSFVKKIHFKNNLDYCPLVCQNSPKQCEKIPQGCPYKEKKSGWKCHETCSEGKCWKPNDPTSCVTCKDFLQGGMCLKKCPTDTLEYFGYRCVSVAECNALGFNTFLGQVKQQRSEDLDESASYADQCVEHCPNGFIRKPSDKTLPGSCQLRNASDACDSAILQNGDLGDDLRYCAEIDGDLEININKGMEKNDIEKLSRNLRNLKDISGRLRIQGDVFFSLYFLSNLRSIGAKINASAQGEFRYVLFILNNINLRELWDSNFNGSKLVINGPVLIKYNEFLCQHEVKKFKKNVLLPRKTEFISGNNGGRAQCNVIPTNLYGLPGPEYGTVDLGFFLMHCGNTILYIMGYNIFFRKVPGKSTLTRYQGRQACADVWSMERKELPEGMNEGCHHYTVKKLQENTRYAFYIETYGFVEDQTRVLSDITYVTTFPKRPECPRDDQAPWQSSNFSLAISWKSPGKIRGHNLFFDVQVDFVDQTPSIQHFVLDGTCDESEKHLQKGDLSQPVVVSHCVEPNVTLGRNDVEGSCLCEPGFPPESYYRDKLELLPLIHININYESKKPPEIPKMVSTSCVYSKNQTSSCSTISQIWNKSDLSHTELSSYEQNDLKINLHTNVPSVSIDLPTDIYKYKGFIKVRSCIENLAACEEMGLTPPCGLCSEFQTWEWKPFNIDYVNNLAAKELKPVVENSGSSNETSNSDDFTTIISWDLDDGKKGLISGYKLTYGPANSEKMFQSVCFSSLNENSDYRTNYRISLPNNGEYKISLKPIPLNGYGKEIQISFTVQRDDENLPILVIIAIGFLAFLLFLVVMKFAYDVIRLHFSWQALPNASYNNFKVVPENVNLLEIIDKGNFRVVYRASICYHDEWKEVAVKTLKPNPKLDYTDADWSLFQEELEMTRTFQSRFIENSFGYVDDLEEPKVRTIPAIYGIFGLCEGNLENYLKYKGVLNEDMMKESLVQIADGMAYLHAQEIVHRDIAARNILVVKFDDNIPHMKLADFGMARYLAKGYYRHRTRTGCNPILSIKWAAPEILQPGNCKHTMKSDVWSFGILAWEVCNPTEKPYSEHSTLTDLAQEISQCTSFIWPGFKEENMQKWPVISSVIIKCTRIDPEKRLPFLKLAGLLYNKRTRNHFRDWFTEMEPFCYAQKESRKDSESTESGIFTTTSLDSSASQEGDEDPLFGDEERLCVSPDAKTGSCISCISNTPLASGYHSNKT